MQLVALVGDAHTAVEPDPSLGLRHYPLELYSFDDGLFVRRADSGHAALVGAKVLRIGARRVEDALTRVGHDHPARKRLVGPRLGTVLAHGRRRFWMASAWRGMRGT